MHEKKSFSMRAEEFLAGKGFYIVLFACVAVIGVSAWLLLFSQFSPLGTGDEGDYLDVMGDVTAPAAGDSDDAGKSTDNSKTNKEDTSKETAGTGAQTQPEHTAPAPAQTTQKPNEPEKDTGALTVQPDPAPPAKSDEDGGEEGEKPSVDISDMVFIWPVNGEITAEHSPAALIYDRTMGDWRTHTGYDIAARLGTKVLSCSNGTVTKVEEDERYGTVVEIDHGAGLTSIYANLAGTPTVNVGDAVTMGSVIGSVGATALYETGDEAHLHFAMAMEGAPVDPGEYLPKR